MKALFVGLLFLCVFVGGGFSGMWMDWSAHKNLTGIMGGQTFTYELEDGNQEARLWVHHGDVIKLVAGGITPKTSLKMDFGNNGPCSESIGDTCTIDSTAKNKDYSFSCSDDKTDRCPDPAVQQQDPPSNGTPPGSPSFRSFVADDFSHFKSLF